MQPTDIAHLVTLGLPSLSPDGATVVVAATRADLDDDEYRSRLWRVPTDGSAPPRLLTHGKHDTEPRWSPNGRFVAFLRAAPGGKPQLHVLAADGGDARVLTDLPLGAGSPVWAPGSRSIAFTARVPEHGRYGQDEDITPDKEPPRRITGLQYRRDGVGFLTDRREHVFVLAVDDGDQLPEARQVTDGDADDHEVSWSPDGTMLAFVSARHESREHDLTHDVFVVSPDGGDPRLLTASTLWLSLPQFVPDGSTIIAAGEDPGPDRNVWQGTNTGLFSIDVTSAGVPRRLTDAESVHLAADRLVITPDAVLTRMENRGAVDLVSIPLGGGAPTTLYAGHCSVTGFDAIGDTVVVAVGDDTTLPELAVVHDGKASPLTDFTAGFTEHVSPRPILEIGATAPDGYPVHGFLVTPAGDGPHPVLLMIHGGPFAQYPWAIFDEAQVYAGAGYAVVYGNPRGSSGYGEAHGRYIIGDVGDRSMPDLIALLDAALERPELDGTRLGVLGGSHGGYMTTWIVGHTDRFAAAVSERAVNAIDSFEGSSDIGWGFGDSLYGADREQQRRQSPLTYADDITTPLLVVHSEQDWRCPLEQGQRLYVALRQRDADVEFLLFPGEGHELSRSGLPSHRVARFEAIVDWFGRYLS